MFQTFLKSPLKPLVYSLCATWILIQTIIVTRVGCGSREGEGERLVNVNIQTPPWILTWFSTLLGIQLFYFQNHFKNAFPSKISFT